MSFYQLVGLILLNLTKNRIKNTTATTANKRPNRKDPKPQNMHHVLTAAAASALAVANAQIDNSPQRIAPIKKTITMGNESSPTFCLLKRFNKFIFFLQKCVLRLCLQLFECWQCTQKQIAITQRKEQTKAIVLDFSSF